MKRVARRFTITTAEGAKGIRERPIAEPCREEQKAAAEMLSAVHEINKPRKKKKKPKKKKLRNWKKKTDEELIAHAQEFMETEGITTRSQLQKADSGLHMALRRRGVFDQVFDDGKRLPSYWKGRTDEELVTEALGIIHEKSRTEYVFKKNHKILYRELKKRNLLGRIPFKVIGEWRGYSDDELIQEAIYIIEDEGIKSREDLRRICTSLNSELRRRKLLARVIPHTQKKRKDRDWQSMTDDEIVEYAKRVIEGQDITSIPELREADSGLWEVTYIRRKLRDRIPLLNKRKRKSWNIMSDDEIKEEARKTIEEEDVTNRTQMFGANRSLYYQLLRRGLMDEVGLIAQRKVRTGERGKQRNWKDKSDDQIVEQALQFIKENEINKRTELKSKYCALYRVLIKRKLIDRVFAEIDAQRNIQAAADMLSVVVELDAT